MDQVNARLERAHHPRCSLVEHPNGDVIKQMTLELKVYDEVNVGSVPDRRECPRVRQVLERPFDGAHVHLSRSVQGHLTGETLLEWTEPDDEVGDNLVRVRAVDSRAAAPGNEQGIRLHVRNDAEKLIGTIGERCLLLVTRHSGSPTVSASLVTNRPLAPPVSS
ncbi:MAG TPA: hypothetical protein VKI44_38145 [Acetobacteraceae bacterium]|nr:hypothetical protein [Acetobacteraceae bacterium]